MIYPTEAALRNSLKHWRRMRAFTRDDFRAPSETPAGCCCALCQRFAETCTNWENWDERCPVYRATEYANCYHTPWSTANKAFHYVQSRAILPVDDDDSVTFDKALAAWHAAADDEIAFLESLLPTTNHAQRHQPAAND